MPISHSVKTPIFSKRWVQSKAVKKMDPLQSRSRGHYEHIKNCSALDKRCLTPTLKYKIFNFNI